MKSILFFFLFCSTKKYVNHTLSLAWLNWVYIEWIIRWHTREVCSKKRQKKNKIRVEEIVWEKHEIAWWFRPWTYEMWWADNTTKVCWTIQRIIGSKIFVTLLHSFFNFIVIVKLSRRLEFSRAGSFLFPMKIYLFC